MTERKRKLIIIQISLLLIGSLIILFTYSDLEVTDKEKIITTETQQKIEEQLKNDLKDGDIFFNSGFPLPFIFPPLRPVT